MFFSASGKPKPLACCDCGLVHQISVHHSTSIGVTLEISRDDVETENARRGRGLRDPLYVAGYDTGSKSRDIELDEVRRDLETALKAAADSGAVFGPACTALMRKYGWKWSAINGWKKE